MPAFLLPLKERRISPLKTLLPLPPMFAPLRPLRSLALLCGLFSVQVDAATETPNIVVIYADDLGYGDLGSYGHPTIRTPPLDRLADEGLRFTDYYSPSPVCTPSRAALLTGRYAVRSGMVGRRGVLFPESHGGLPDNEITIAEMLRDRGYATAHVGKWHLGIHEGSRPLDQGFDQSFGIPYSNDMDGTIPNAHDRSGDAEPDPAFWNVPLMRDGEIIERPVDQTTVTRRYTEEAVAFIKSHRDHPFFLHFAHTFPHVPLYASPEYKDQSPRGIYGDVVEELDASVGTVIETLRELGLAENTFVVFTSDNGPWLTKGLQGGSAGLLRDGKGTTWEGGQRVPAIAWWPSQIPAGTTRQFASSLDLFPTIAALTGSDLPGDRIIDGQDLSRLLFDGAEMPNRPFFFYAGRRLAACRYGPFKLHRYTTPGFARPYSDLIDPPELYQLGLDPSESLNVTGDYPEVIATIQAAISAHESSIKPVPEQLYD